MTFVTAGVTAFEGHRRLASGSLADVIRAVKPRVDKAGKEPIVIFNDENGRVVDVDFRGSVDDVVARVTPSAAAGAGPGRPKLGVVGREVTLLPRHWDWLNSQPGGASVALRKLIDEARKTNQEADRVRLAQDATNRFLTAMAGNLPNYEEATRALFAGKRKKFKREMEDWPEDIREHALRISADCFSKSGDA